MRPDAQMDIVYTVDDYWDGPREGVATFRGEPHAYRCVFDDARDDWSDRFVLTPIGPATLQDVLAAWDRCRRWESAHRAGLTPRETHPALPYEHGRYLELKSRIDGAVATKKTQSFIARGVFTVREEPSSVSALVGEPSTLHVAWNQEPHNSRLQRTSCLRLFFLGFTVCARHEAAEPQAVNRRSS
jgi:hypothetical protein